MLQDEHHQLEWVAKNRTRRSRLSQAGSAIEKIVTTVEQKGLKPALAAAKAMSPIVDDEFRRHCRIAGVVNGRVTIYVDVPTLVSVMRRKWLGAIREGLSVVNRRLGDGAIVFELGQAGVEIPPV